MAYSELFHKVKYIVGVNQKNCDKICKVKGYCYNSTLDIFYGKYINAEINNHHVTLKRSMLTYKTVFLFSQKN